MQQRYVSLGHWVDKETKTPRSRLVEVKGGKSKTGNQYELAEADKAIIVDGQYAVGTIIKANVQFDFEKK
jgi:hypothetical protein